MESTFTITGTRGAMAAFADAARRLRVPSALDAVMPAAYVPPMIAAPACPAAHGVITERKRVDGSNQRVFMIQAGAAGAGASGPSPWRCPV